MKCESCGSEMKRIVCKYVTVNRCPNERHKEVLEWDEMFLR